MVKKGKTKIQNEEEQVPENIDSNKNIVKQVVEVIDLEKTVITQVPSVLQKEPDIEEKNDTPSEQLSASQLTPETEEVDGEEWDGEKQNLISEKENSINEETQSIKGEKQKDKSQEEDIPKSKQVVEELFSKGNADISIHKQAARKPIIWAITVIVAAVVTGIGLIIFSTKTPSSTIKTPEPTPSVDTVISPSPVPIVDRGTIHIEVLNGGGIAGAAGKMKVLLEEKGYIVDKTGNADNYTFDKTQISVKKSQEAVLKLLQEDLSGTYTIGTPDTDLAESSEADIVITVGKE